MDGSLIKTSLENLSVDAVRNLGFPYLVLDNTYLSDFEKLTLLDSKSLLRVVDNKKIVCSKNLKQSRLASVFFPHMLSTKVNNYRTPMEAFNNDVALIRSMKLAKKYNRTVTTAGLRSMLQMVSHTQGVSNFKPDVSKFIYDEYGNSGKVYDFSAGYGGRLVGFLASSCIEYVGVDVNKVNFPCYEKLINAYKTDNKITKLICIGSEDYIENQEYFDLAFSSPPYFNKEHYSEDDEQSYIKFPTYDDWLGGYFYNTISNTVNMLKNNGVLALNIKDIKNGKKVFPLESDALSVCLQLNIKHIDTLYMELNTTLNSGSGKIKKLEPIFIFKKV